MNAVYVLRTCTADMKSHNGFVWPDSGPVEAPDWSPEPACGGGLHGLLFGVGDYGLLRVSDPLARWLVVEVDEETIVTIDSGKVKFPRGNVVYCGSMPGALALIAEKRRLGMQPKESTTGNRAPASTTGYAAPASTTGNRAPASTTGNRAPASTTGNRAPASTTGNRAPASTTGYAAPASTTGYAAPASTTGYAAPASTTGYAAPASTTGEHSVACCLGMDGRAKAGPNGSLILTYWDGSRLRHLVGYVGEAGIKQDTWYRVHDGQLTEVAE